MGRTKGKNQEGGAIASSSSSGVSSSRASSLSPAPNSTAISVSTPVQMDIKIKDLLKELFTLIRDIQVREAGYLGYILISRFFWVFLSPSV